MNKKGFTLIELLAVIVIMGIILAIAVPSTVGIIDKSKRDSHVKNAQILVSTIKTAIVNENITINMNEGYVFSLSYFLTKNYIDNFKDPDGGDYDSLDTYVVVVNDGGVMKYYVQLVGDSRHLSSLVFTPLREANDLTADDVRSNTEEYIYIEDTPGVFSTNLGVSVDPDTYGQDY